MRGKEVICVLCRKPILESKIPYYVENENEKKIKKGYVHEECLKEKIIKDKQPIVIDMNLIRSLRFEGRYGEAAALLEQFRADCKNEQNEIKKEFDSRDRKIVTLNCKKLNLCRYCRKEEPLPGKSICAKCKEEKRQSYLKEQRYKSNLVKKEA